MDEASASPEASAPPSLVRAARAFRYVDSLPRIEGWLNETTALAIIEALWLQERAGIAGNLAEIGVFQGKSFLALAAGASPADRLLAVDIFDATAPTVAAERPEHNVLAYGQGNEARFRANLAEYFPAAEVEVIARSSTDLRGREREFGLDNLRFLSIDGGHTRRLTLNDLRIADACLTVDGLCCLDDVFNVHWLGVVSGLFEFLQSDPGLVPVALFPNKLFLSRPARKPFYAGALRRLFPEALERERLELHRAEVDVFGDIWPKVGGALRAIAGRAAADLAAAAAGEARAIDRAADAEAAVAAAEARVAKLEAVVRSATARAERVERKLAKSKAKRRSWFRLGGAGSATTPPATGAANQLVEPLTASGTDRCRADAAAAGDGCDEAWYLAAYPDVAAAVAEGSIASGRAHYRAHGQAEGRRGSAGGPANVATGEDERRRRINAVWSADAERRAAESGWYWLAHPSVMARVNTKISGDPACDAYGRLRQVLAERGWAFPIGRAVSLGCGFGNLERDLAGRGMVRSFDAFDLAEGAIEQARRLAREAGLDSICYHVADLDALDLTDRSLDAVFAHQSVHHVENLEALYRSVRTALRPGGVFHLHEFVGPSRFQWTDTQLAAVNGYLNSLPAHLRRLPAGRAKPMMRRPTIEAMVDADPSEAIRSADIMEALDPYFEIIERRDIGGTLLHLALGDIAQNFDPGNVEDQCHLQRLFDLEDRMLADGSIYSDFVVVTALPRLVR